MNSPLNAVSPRFPCAPTTIANTPASDHVCPHCIRSRPAALSEKRRRRERRWREVRNFRKVSNSEHIRKDGTLRANDSSDGATGSTGSVGSRGASVPVEGATVGRTTAVSYGAGSTRVITIPQGQLFAGRTSGGGTRDAIYGNRQVVHKMHGGMLADYRASYRMYGSGYPGVNSLGVANRGFPFVYWPFIWGAGFGYGAVYLHTAHLEVSTPLSHKALSSGG